MIRDTIDDQYLNQAVIGAVDVLQLAWLGPVLIACVIMFIACSLLLDWRSNRAEPRSLHWAIAVGVSGIAPLSVALSFLIPEINPVAFMQPANVIFAGYVAVGLMSSSPNQEVGHRFQYATLSVAFFVWFLARVDTPLLATLLQAGWYLPVLGWAIIRLVRLGGASLLVGGALAIRWLAFVIALAAVLFYGATVGGQLSAISQTLHVLVALAMAELVLHERRDYLRMNGRWLGAAGEIATMPVRGVGLASSADQVLALLQSRLDAAMLLMFVRDSDRTFRSAAAIGNNGKHPFLATLIQQKWPELIEEGALGTHSQIIGVKQLTEAAAENALSQEIAALTHLVLIPIRNERDSIGLLLLGFDQIRRPPSTVLQAADIIGNSVALNAELAGQLAEVRGQARADALTGLPNRLGLHERFDHCVKEAPEVTGFMMLMDLDRFKEINDSLGHLTGDLLLKQVAERMQSFCDVYGVFCARLGGDEFALMRLSREDASDSVVFNLAEELNIVIRAPYEIQDLRITIDSSIGIARFPKNGADSHELLRCADVAMYHAKVNNMVAAHYSDQLDGGNRERLELSSMVHTAMEEEQFELFYQPKVELRTGATMGAEALIRWHHPERGWIPPGRFIPVIEIGPQIDDVSLWVAQTALAQLKLWQARGYRWSVSINVSARNLLSDRWCDAFVGLVDNAMLQEGSLEIEITETSLMSNPAAISRRLAAIARAGVKIAIDDFGTGYSSLSYLQRQDFDTLKIDQSFVSALAINEQSRRLVNSMISMAANLGIRVVAEGIEDAADAAILAEAGCDYGQGYLYTPALPAAEFEQWAKDSIISAQ